MRSEARGLTWNDDEVVDGGMTDSARYRAEAVAIHCKSGGVSVSKWLIGIDVWQKKETV